ncbi:hypothetical protein GCM10023205_71520 [Yinghuangia aomiensis]|uniref:Uncharacterized protein n=1 Tax=Yinghuangia aomiensis TaxID=676205 RepID=A0ABP9I8B0_9ACTN
MAVRTVCHCAPHLSASAHRAAHRIPARSVRGALHLHPDRFGCSRHSVDLEDAVAVVDDAEACVAHRDQVRSTIAVHTRLLNLSASAERTARRLWTREASLGSDRTG